MAPDLFLTAGETLTGTIRQRCRESGISTRQGTIAEMGAALAGPEPPDYLLVDHRELDNAAARTLRGVLRRSADTDVPISVLFGQMTSDDITDVLFGPGTIDQVLEVRTEQDVRGAIDKIIEHIRTRSSPAPEGSITVGSVYRIGSGDYSRARTRSLVSQRMGGFIADLRAAVGRLNRHPLAARPPWDPYDTQDLRLGKQGPQGWEIVAKANQTPNLTLVLNAHTTTRGRQLLSGEAVDDQEWRTKWSSNPPALLITGESGTGKTLVAQVIGDFLRSVQPAHGVRGRFVRINCGALTASSFEHIMMGSAPGNWTGIDQAVPGELARAAHGVVFLDEIGDLDLDVQRALLTFLDDRLIRPTNITPFNGHQHVIAATNRDVEVGANQRWFRNDLLARFALRLEIPPLRDRGADEIGELLDFVAQDPSANPPRRGGGLTVGHISGEVRTDLLRREYRDGNFRELTQIVHAGIRNAGRRYSPTLELQDLPPRRPRRFRSDADSNTVAVESVTVPDGASVVNVPSQADLRFLAEREHRVMLTDEGGAGWVLTGGTYYRAAPEPGAPIG